VCACDLLVCVTVHRTQSYGLVATPKVKFQQLQRMDAASKRKNQPRGLQKPPKDSDASSDDGDGSDSVAGDSDTESTDSALSSSDESASSDSSDESDEETDVLMVKKVDRLDDSEAEEVCGVVVVLQACIADYPVFCAGGW
jgi:hypothetical protein